MLHVDVEHLTTFRALVRLRGDLDQDTAPTLERTLYHCLTAGRPHLRIDCAALRFCDSAGINTLLGAHRAAGELGGRVRVVRPSDGLLTVLAMTGLDHILIAHHDRDGHHDSPTSSFDGVESAFAPGSALSPLERLQRLQAVHEARRQERRLAIEDARTRTRRTANGRP